MSPGRIKWKNGKHYGDAVVYHFIFTVSFSILILAFFMLTGAGMLVVPLRG